MPYHRSDMLYDVGDYYKWTAKADHDNPYYRTGADHSMLNKTEGYEVLTFINHLGAKFWPSREVSLSNYQKIERMIKLSPGQQTHKKKEEWIHANWSSH
ncbi:MAG: hypothetical protein ACXVMS_07080 [Flavisolibacter sp.]